MRGKREEIDHQKSVSWLLWKHNNQLLLLL
jgi:hypothetical protein